MSILDDTQIIILAGGKGRRMGSDIPKVLIKINGYSLIDYLLKTVYECKFKFKPIIVIGFNGEMVKNVLGKNLIYAKQKEQLGTGHAVMSAKEKIDLKAKNIIVLYGDMPNISSETILNLAEMHNKEKATFSMITIRVENFLGDNNCFYGFGRVVRDKNKKIKKIVEVKDANEEEKNITELNPSIFCFDKVWLLNNLNKLNNNNAQAEYYLTDLAEMIIEQGEKISSLEISAEECIGVNTPEELERAEKIISNF